MDNLQGITKTGQFALSLRSESPKTGGRVFAKAKDAVIRIGWELAVWPKRDSLRLLPFGPDRVGETSALTPTPDQFLNVSEPVLQWYESTGTKYSGGAAFGQSR